jgi:hypothetical protein
MENDVTITTNGPALGISAPAAAVDQKGIFDFLGGIVPGLAQAAAPSIGIDPRVAGQAMSQVLNIFGIGGPGKAFSPALPKAQALGQLQQVLTPYLNDPTVNNQALQKWLQAAIEPVLAHKQGKAYQPSVDWSKSWLSDAWDTVSDTVSTVDWGQVAQIGTEVLPYAVALL